MVALEEKRDRLSSNFMRGRAGGLTKLFHQKRWRKRGEIK